MSDERPINLRKKPKVLYVRHKNPSQTWRRQGHNPDEFVKFLSHFFDISIQAEDFDLLERCDIIQPELIIYEALGGNRTELLKIRNPNVHNDTPRIGLMIDDPHDTCRVRFVKFLNDMGVTKVFSISSALVRQSPEFSGSTFSMPHQFDVEEFDNFSLKKIIPISVFGFGSYSPMYNWRSQNLPQLIGEFPTLVYRHPGYGDVKLPHRFSVTGREYGELLNQSYFSIADGTRSAYCVRKHIEIPASFSVLVSPEFEELKQYGFKDMENCIMGTGRILLEKIAEVSGDAELYRRICRAGYDHVHEHYDYRKNNLIFDWFVAEKNKNPDEEVIQNCEFGGFSKIEIVKKVTQLKKRSRNDSDYQKSMNNALLTILDNHSTESDEKKLLEVVDWCHYQEPWVLLGLISLLNGDYKTAADRLLQPYKIRLNRDGQASLDPVEAGWLWFLCILIGDEKNTEMYESQIGAMAHVLCRRFLKLSELFAGRISQLEACEETEFERSKDLWSIHWVGAHISFDEWKKLILRMIDVQQRQVN
ncbi:glycosyltransferase [Alphaproteobacteria bacterium]|nr:glycosyltransferase [Alphaproteobacteria bacterium]